MIAVPFDDPINRFSHPCAVHDRLPAVVSEVLLVPGVTPPHVIRIGTVSVLHDRPLRLE